MIRLLLTFTLIACTPATAASNPGFQSWLEKSLWPEAKRSGIARATFDMAFKGITFDPKMPELKSAAPKRQTQSEFRAPEGYFNQRSIDRLAKQGAALEKRWRDTLARIEKRTGVPRRIILAIWGRESVYGTFKMPKNAIRSLATSAYAGRRSELFKGELIAALRIIQEGHISAKAMGSSWAGALGQPQFLPSKFFDYAVDEDGDGKRDIWNSVPDTLGSIANYLAKFGWQRGRDWGFEVTIPASVSCSLGGPDQGRKIAGWAGMGIERVSGRPFPKIELANTGYLLFPAGRYGPTFVTTPNFYVLKQYNESDLYALFVGHLADRMAGGKAFRGRWQDLPSYTRAEVKRMQDVLVAQGYDVGGADGLIGYKSRNAIGKWQNKVGRAATCFPSRETIKAIR
ncbi:lytic murein transglycosylase [Pseudahrensia aquimaris]|uniref:Lytic murein transglycosylase n=1 Tax=Pseudahrensia aquimaris TaxID=744461 RepID=A0ABW3FGI2_9HYPH